MARQTLNQSQIVGTTLGYAEITSNFTSTSVTTDVDVTGLSTTVTVPPGGRRVKVTVNMGTFANGNTTFIVKIREGSTELQRFDGQTLYTGSVTASFIPTAGSHTYKVTIYQTGAGTMTVRGATTAPSFILVELI